MNKIKPNQFFFLFFVFIFGTNGSTCCVASIIEHSSALALVRLLITVFHGLSFTSPSVMFSGMNASVTNFHWTCETSAKHKECSCVFKQRKLFVAAACSPNTSTPCPPPSSFSVQSPLCWKKHLHAQMVIFPIVNYGCQRWKNVLSYEAAAMTLVWVAKYLLKM